MDKTVVRADKNQKSIFIIAATFFVSPGGDGHARVQRPEVEPGGEGDGESRRGRVHQGQVRRRVQAEVGPETTLVPVNVVDVVVYVVIVTDIIIVVIVTVVINVVAAVVVIVVIGVVVVVAATNVADGNNPTGLESSSFWKSLQILA